MYPTNYSSEEKMVNGKDILERYNDQKVGKIDGFIPLETMIDEAITKILKEQDRNTRHACAEACLSCDTNTEAEERITNLCHNLCMNVKAYGN